MNRYISDLHFGHANILKFDNRPFRNTEEMETSLIENWNNTVLAGDTTYILGDFCWGKEPEWKRIVPLLNGNKVLIRGNHDLKEMTSSLKKMFQDINDFLNKWRAELKNSRSLNSHNCGNIINVGCMLPYMGYTPRTLDEIIKANS